MAGYQNVQDTNDPYNQNFGHNFNPTERGQYGGQGARGYLDENGNPVQTQKSGAQQATERYQQMGADAANRGAYQANYGDFQYGQGQVQNALALQQAAAEGKAPSAAEIAGKAAMDRSLSNQVAAAGSVRGGPMAQASAYRTAQRVGAGNEAQMTAGIQAGRANEMAQARGQYGQTGLAYGQNALGQTGQQQQSELFQRGLNQAGQMGYEQMGQNVQQAQLNADMGQASQIQQNNQFQQSQDFAKQQADRQYYTPGGVLGFSDVRAKQPLTTADVAAQDQKKLPAWLKAAQQEYEYGGGAARDTRMHRGHENFGRDELYTRDNPYGNAATDIADYENRSNPALDERQMQYSQQPGVYGDDTPPGWLDQYMVSDERAKEAARGEGFRAGITFAAHGSGGGPLSATAAQMANKVSPKVAREIAPAMIAARDATGPVAPSPAGPLFNAARKAGRDVADMKREEIELLRPARPQDPREAVTPVSGMAGGVRGKAPGSNYGNAPLPPDESPYPPNDLGERGASFEYSDEKTKEDANRKMEASFYAYKDGFTPPEQGKGEPNYGPMAQSLEKNPITATTVKKDPNGLRMVDMAKLTKVHSGAIASLQNQIDEMRYGNAHR